MHCPSSSCETALEPKEPETSIIYCRERTRKTRAGEMEHIHLYSSH